MSEVEFAGGVKRSRYPWDAIVVRTLVWGFVMGNVAGVLGLALLGFTFLGFTFLSLLPVIAFIGGLVGLGSALVGLLLGVVIWAAMGRLRVDIPRRASVAAVAATATLTASWFVLVVTTGIAAELLVHTILLSIVIVSTAVILPWRMRRRFLDAIQADPDRVAGASGR